MRERLVRSQYLHALIVQADECTRLALQRPAHGLCQFGIHVHELFCHYIAVSQPEQEVNLLVLEPGQQILAAIAKTFEVCVRGAHLFHGGLEDITVRQIGIRLVLVFYDRLDHPRPAIGDFR